MVLLQQPLLVACIESILDLFLRRPVRFEEARLGLDDTATGTCLLAAALGDPELAGHLLVSLVELNGFESFRFFRAFELQRRLYVSSLEG